MAAWANTYIVVCRAADCVAGVNVGKLYSQISPAKFLRIRHFGTIQCNIVEL